MTQAVPRSLLKCWAILDVGVLVRRHNARVVKRHVGHFEKQAADAWEMTGTERSVYQRAFHRAVKLSAEVAT